MVKAQSFCGAKFQRFNKGLNFSLYTRIYTCFRQYIPSFRISYMAAGHTHPLYSIQFCDYTCTAHALPKSLSINLSVLLAKNKMHKYPYLQRLQLYTTHMPPTHPQFKLWKIYKWIDALPRETLQLCGQRIKLHIVSSFLYLGDNCGLLKLWQPRRKSIKLKKKFGSHKIKHKSI